MNDSNIHTYGDGVRPNVIWFMVDQMRAQALSLAGDPNVHTPNLDRMARDGAWFRNACMGFPLCCPARGAMLTGTYPHRCVPGHEYFMPSEMTTVADPFNEAGYHTAWLGKWHLDGFHEGPQQRAALHLVPRERRGRFATWIGYENNNSQFDCWVHGHDGDSEVPLHRLPGHETDCLTDMLLEQVERHREDPFFMCCSVQPPHGPYSAPAQWAGRHNPATIELRPNVPRGGAHERKAREGLSGYYALIEHIDHNVGRLLDRLQELDLADRTYVVFVSDHGDQHGCHGHSAKMTPHEESIRVPLMIWGGHRWHYRNVSRPPDPFNHVDLAPTSLGLCGIPVPESMQGYDYSPAAQPFDWRDGRRRHLVDAPGEAYLQCVVPTGHGSSMDVPWRGIVTADNWKYVALPGQAMMLFDLDADPYEQCNLAWHGHARERRVELNDRLRSWVERTGDEFPLPEYGQTNRPCAVDTLRKQFADRWR
ncbi:MAG: sulfatase [Planctomycetota bacterium]